MNEFKSDNGYKPTEKEEFMSEQMAEYFTSKLLHMKEGLLERNQNSNLDEDLKSMREPDANDRATIEEEASLDLKSQARLAKISQDVDVALEKIKNKDYGYCEETDEPISVLRLDAVPTTRYSIEALRELEKANGNKPL